MLRCSLVLAASMVACGGAPPPAPAAPAAPEVPAVSTTPSTDAVDTGKDCAKAEAKCGGGACNIHVKNGCDTPVRCALEIAVACTVQGGTSEANAADHATIDPHGEGDVGAQAACSGGQVARTSVRTLACK